MQDGFLSVAVATPEVRLAECGFNASRSAALIRQAANLGVKVLVLPELGLTGCTCGDLFWQQTLLEGAEAALAQLLHDTAELELLFVACLPVARLGLLYSCAAVCQKGKILGVVPKQQIAPAGALNQARYFSPAPPERQIISLCSQQVPFGPGLLFACRELPQAVIGVELSEDLYAPAQPSQALAADGATILCCPCASREVIGAAEYRRQLVTGQSARLTAAYLCAGCGDGESTSDLVFLGHDLIASNGILLAQRRDQTGLLAAELDVQLLSQERLRSHAPTSPVPGRSLVVPFSWTMEETALTRPLSPSPFVPNDPAQREQVCQEALLLCARGLQRRISHTGAKTAVLGLSGGLDSTLALLVTLQAFDRLGRDRKDILAVTMPCFGTTDRTKSNAELLARQAGCSFRIIPIGETVRSHFRDISQPMDRHDVTFENGQARERTQVLMDLANMTGGLVIGTGDLSELALGWATYNGDHMSSYGVNASIPKTLVRHLVAYAADTCRDSIMANVLRDILDTPVSPELLPAVDGVISQETEALVGPYELHDFFLYYALRYGFSPRKILRLARHAMAGRYPDHILLQWLRSFYRRFFSQQFKRSCLPEGPGIGTVGLSPRGAWQMPSDAQQTMWQQELSNL